MTNRSRARAAVIAAVVVIGAVIAVVAGVLSSSSKSKSTAPVTPATSAPGTSAPGTSVGSSVPSTTPGGSTPGLPALTGPTAAPPLSQLPQPVVTVTSSGAVADGTTDDTASILSAITKAQANGKGTVYFPAGRYAVSSKGLPSIKITGGPAITLAGAGMDQSTIIETSHNVDLLSAKVDGLVIQDLGFDTRTHSAGHCIGMVANHTTLQRLHIMSGSHAFAIYYAGPKGATPLAATYNVGNQVLDTVVEDNINDDGFSFSFQKDGLIRDIVHRGSRLAIYIDDNLTVDGYQFVPGTQRNAANGYYITPPSTNITINGFVSTGAGGIIGAAPKANPARVSTNIAISGEQMRNPGYQLQVGDVDGLTITASSLAGELVFNPAVRADRVAVGQSTLAAVTFAPKPAGAVGNPVFDSDTYSPVSAIPGRVSTATFVTRRGNVTFTATGGQFHNQSGGLQSGANTHMQASVPGA